MAALPASRGTCSLGPCTCMEGVLEDCDAAVEGGHASYQVGQQIGCSRGAACGVPRDTGQSFLDADLSRKARGID